MEGASQQVSNSCCFDLCYIWQSLWERRKASFHAGWLWAHLACSLKIAIRDGKVGGWACFALASALRAGKISAG